jgi:hypothetical protein
MNAQFAMPFVAPSLVSPLVMEDLKKRIEAAYYHIDRFPSDFDEDVRVAQKWGGLSVTQLRRYFGNTVMPTIENVFLSLEQQGDVRIEESVCVFRRILPDKSTYIYWHTDADGTGSWPFDPLWNCWMPLENVGVDYPSLELIEDSEAFMRTVPPLHPGHRTDEWIDKNFPPATRRIMCPAMSPGDGLVFSHCVLHRTQPMQKLKGPRIGFEIRFVQGDKPRWKTGLRKRWRRLTSYLSERGESADSL